MKLKKDCKGNISRFKARLMVQANLQTNEAGDIGMYALVPCIELVRMLLSIEATHGFAIDHLDMESAFLHASLPEQDHAWTKMPKTEGGSRADGCTNKLQESFRGLKQAPKMRHQLLCAPFQGFNFDSPKTRDCLFTSRDTSKKVFTVVYGDDLLVIGSREVVEKAKKLVSLRVRVIASGQCSHFLRTRVDHREHERFLSQEAYP